MNSDEKKEKVLNKIKEFCLFDDDFMSRVFEGNYECIELILHIIMERTDLKVKDAKTQYSIKNLSGRSVRLDIYAIDDYGKKYNIEVQRATRGANPKRARYNSSIIDANSLKSGTEYLELPETYVIFITENDIMEAGMPIYHIDRVVKETGKQFNDEAHILYVNGSCRDNTPLGQLMHDFACKNPNEMYYKILADRTRYFKEDEKGVSDMSQLVEELIDDEKKESALRFLKIGKLSNEEIADALKLSVEVVDKIAEENNIVLF